MQLEELEAINASFKDAENLQLAQRKECKLDELEQCVKSNCIYNIHKRLNLFQI